MSWYCLVNQQRYGPVERELLIEWVRQGRLRPTDLVWTEGMDQWTPAGQTEALADAFALAGPPVQAADPQAAGVRENAPGAVTSMVLGIVGAFFGGCAGTGLILGILALHYRKRAMVYIESDPLRWGGQGMATAGYVLGIIDIILGALGLVYFVIWVSLFGTMMCAAGSGAFPP